MQDAEKALLTSIRSHLIGDACTSPTRLVPCPNAIERWTRNPQNQLSHQLRTDKSGQMHMPTHSARNGSYANHARAADPRGAVTQQGLHETAPNHSDAALPTQDAEKALPASIRSHLIGDACASPTRLILCSNAAHGVDRWTYQQHSHQLRIKAGNSANAFRKKRQLR